MAMAQAEAFHHPMVYESNASRILQPSFNGGADGRGTIVLLTTIGILICYCICAPCFCQRGLCRRSRRGSGHGIALDATLGWDTGVESATPHGMTLADRKDYVANVLVTKKVVVAEDDHVVDLAEQERKKSDLMIHASSMADESQCDDEDGDRNNTCAICLTAYKAGEEICWSHNQQCNHVFHRHCIIQWLLRHDECPCCRHNFLSLDDEREEPPTGTTPNQQPSIDSQSDDDSTSSAYLRGMYLFDRIHLMEEGRGGGGDGDGSSGTVSDSDANQTSDQENPTITTTTDSEVETSALEDWQADSVGTLSIRYPDHDDQDGAVVPQKFCDEKIVVSDAGSDFLNGVYHKSGTFDGAGRYVMPGVWKGRSEEFSVFRCSVVNSTKLWYISIVPSDAQPGTNTDIDFYSAPMDVDNPDYPPERRWTTARVGIGPAPVVKVKADIPERGD